MAHPVRVLDDPAWSFTHPYAGTPVIRRLRVWRTEPGRVTAVVTERGPGMSITNAAEHVVAAVSAAYPDAVVTVVEHYPAGVGVDLAEHFDTAELDHRGAPSWRRVPREQMVAAFGREVLDAGPSPASDVPGGACAGPHREAGVDRRVLAAAEPAAAG